ncbi:cytochrome P450 [Mycena albidolilacea]|uniref:Cytochrome P450 n=1 Tax=Mycena albidolilacea TaxID=1033008 RepID=A0AAD7ELQ2_9AGAR|nr:cytochrome P450 [Mycena albidolilacea]
MHDLNLDGLKPLIQYGALAAIGLSLVYKAVHKPKRDDEIPIVGSSGFLSNYLDPFRFLFKAPEFIQRGYNLYPNGIFRVAHLYRWEYIVCGPKLVKEVGNTPESVLSFYAGVEETVQGSYTLGRTIAQNPYHQLTVRTSLTRNLHTRFPDVRDEIVCAFGDALQLQGSEWKAFQVLPITMDIVSRVSNRLFVGLPLCRNKEYLDNNIRNTIDVVKCGTLISLFPEFMRPIVGPLISRKEQNIAKALVFLGPLLEDRLAKEAELGPDWPGKPNDLISWLLEIAVGDQRTPTDLALRILGTNMASIHTSSMAFTHALFDLTTHPEHFLPMREEAERVIGEEGWTKAALNNMTKIDSFLRESQRHNPTGPLVMQRRVISKDGFRFSDGTVLPHGAFMSVASLPAHFDPSNYENATTFDGFRFERERVEHMSQHDPADQDIFKRHMISVAPDHLPFGTGKHACPGRFFAATELKAMLAHLLINYDIKAEVEGVRPPNMVFGTAIAPSPTGKVYFRKRQ